jgi:DNA ligase-1
MNKTFEILEKIEQTKGTNAKLELLSQLKDNEFSKWYFETSLNPYLTYGMDEILVRDIHLSSITFENLVEARKQLIERTKSGNSAKMLVSFLCHSSDMVANKWIKRMWLKDLRIGLAEKNINKVFKKLIPEFSLMLCDKMNDKIKLDSSWIVQYKFDGLRCVFIVENGKFIKAMSRNGKELYNINHIGEELAKLFENGVLDGEIYGKDWNETASVVRSAKTAKTSKDIKFYIFDYIFLEEYKRAEGKITLRERMKILENKIPKDFQNIIRVESCYIRDNEDAWSKADFYLKLGYEGAVVKQLDSVYEFGRSKKWLKLKFEDTWDLQIIKYEEGEGKYVGMLGAFICDLKGIEVRVGGGYTDEQRKEFWKEKDNMLGKTIEVKAQEKTKDGSLRFPVFVRERIDK